MDNISKPRTRGETESSTFSRLLVGGALLLATLAADCCLVFMGPYECTSDASFEKEAGLPPQACVRVSSWHAEEDEEVNASDGFLEIDQSQHKKEML